MPGPGTNPTTFLLLDDAPASPATHTGQPKKPLFSMLRKNKAVFISRWVKSESSQSPWATRDWKMALSVSLPPLGLFDQHHLSPQELILPESNTLFQSLSIPSLDSHAIHIGPLLNVFPLFPRNKAPCLLWSITRLGAKSLEPQTQVSGYHSVTRLQSKGDPSAFRAAKCQA